MTITRSIRNKLFLLLIVMGALPVVIVIAVDAVEMVRELEDAALKNGLLRNSVVSEHVTELFEKNFNVLHSLTLNPIIGEYLKNPRESQRLAVLNLLKDTNTILHDRNVAALTDANAMQLIRTDNSQPVSLIGRQHFHEAMQGRDFISDIIVSRSTGEKIVVAEVPVKDRLNRPIGMLQRNFDLKALNAFVQTQATQDISVIIIDRKGKTIAHSDKSRRGNFEYEEVGRYKFIADRAHGDTGVIRTQIDGVDSFASYSRNWKSDWIIISVQPYSQISKQVYFNITESATIGFLILAAVCAVAHILAARATKPIIDITSAADKIVKGNRTEKLEVNSADELGQMAAAFNQIRSARDAYQLESELDKLTKLYNKTATENIGKLRIQNFTEQENGGAIMALYIIDLDHFKEANDTRGHQFGDKVLVEFSNHLRKKFRPSDCIGRFGGDEFVVILDNLPGMEIVIRKARDIKSVAAELAIDGQNAGITASIGIAIVPKDGTDYDTIFKAADNALYHVKANGRNGFYYAGAEFIG